MELERYAKILWKWAWLIVLSAAVAGVSSYFATRNSPRIYQTKTTIAVCQVTGISSSELYLCQQRAQIYSQLAKREPIVQGALTELGLGDKMDWRAVANNVSSSIVAGTQLMEIYVNDTYPERARALADALARQIILQSSAAAEDPELEDRAFIEQQLTDLEGKIDGAQEEIKGLQAELDEAISARRIQELQGQIDVLESKISGWQSTYAQLRTSLQGREASQLTVVEPAMLPTTPIAPNILANLALAVAIGATLAGGAAFLLDYMDDTIKTSAEVERITSLTTLGYIAPDEENHHDDLPIAARSPSALVVENYRALSTNIQLSSGMLSKLGRRGGDQLGRTLIVTSTGPYEGKSTTAANLAVVMAQSGMDTILVDADLRRPVMHRAFNLENRGLTETVLKMGLMKDEEAAADAALSYLQPSGVDNLRVLASGTPTSNAAELLGSDQMEQLIHVLERSADIVLFDTPPILAVTDAIILAAQVDGILLVVQSGKTRRPMLERAMEALEPLEKTGTPTLGVVLNRAPSSSGGYYYYDHYSSNGREPGKGRRSAKKRPGRAAGAESPGTRPAVQKGTGEPESPTPSLS
jgi:capsular exopolysaccharide synthesis family protein